VDNTEHSLFFAPFSIYLPLMHNIFSVH